MIKIEKKKDCCGCGACSQVCPKKCISLKNDKEGFRYPKIDKEKCIDCGLCEKVCPIINAQKKSEDVLKSYIAIAKDNELREKSSSGGMFNLFANHIIDKGGIVFGVVFDDDFSAHHVGIEKKDELYKFLGSKYLQSRTENTYSEAKTNLDKGRIVLYSGTSCQITGLKNFLRKDYDNLYTVDVLCHGVPSPKVWKKYIAEQEKNYGKSVKQPYFRSKDTGWKRYALKLEFSDSSSYVKTHPKDPYMQMFLGNTCIRPSCHDCKFKALERDSDITIGDAWGIENHSPELDDNRGASAVFIQTEKGKELFEAILSQIKIKEIQKDILLPPKMHSRVSVTPHPNRAKFFNALNNGADCKTLTKLSQPSLYKKCRTLKGKAIKQIKNIIKK